MATCTLPGGGLRRRALLKCPTQPRRLARCEVIGQTCIEVRVGIEYFVDAWIERIGPEPSYRQTGRAAAMTDGWGQALRANWFLTPDYPGYNVRNHFEYFIAQTGGEAPSLRCPLTGDIRFVSVSNEGVVSNIAGPFVHHANFTLAGRDYLDVSVSETRWLLHSNWLWRVHNPSTSREFFAATCCPWGGTPECPGGALPTITRSWEELTGHTTEDDNYCLALPGSPEEAECQGRASQWSNVRAATGSVRVYLIVSGAVQDGDRWIGQPGALSQRIVNMVYEFTYDDYEGRAARTADPTGHLEHYHLRVGGILIDNLNPETWGFTDVRPQLPDPPPGSWDCWDDAWYETEYVHPGSGFEPELEDWAP